MRRKIKSFKEVCKITKKLQKQGKKIVFCHGFFDILHMGHVTLLLEAKKHGDILVVGVDHDNNAKILKGPKRPINSHKSRMMVLSVLEPVDYVFLIESFKSDKEEVISDLYLEKYYSKLKPDIVVTTLKAGSFGNHKKKLAEKIGAKFVDIDKGIYKNNTSRVIKLLELE